MRGAWRRLGPLALDLSRAPAWAGSHAALPVVEPLEAGVWNVYLSVRDHEGRARIGRTTLSGRGPYELTPLDPDPVLDLGVRGAFDDSGVVTSCLVHDDGRRYLFYTGWRRGVTVPFYLGIGVAVSDGGGPFRRLSRAPIVQPSDAEPFLAASPFVLRDSQRWRMWYVSGTGWRDRDGEGAEPCYNIRHRDSNDLTTWDGSSTTCLDYGPGEHAFGRPWVRREPDGYRMWFSVRGSRYRIESAESVDGIAWQRDDGRGGLGPAAEGWDSEMVEYPCVFECEGRLFMLYNGNDYGRTGVGLAVWEPQRR